MEFIPYTLKWLELILRWGHVLFAILWVGNSFLFNYLDNKLNKNISSDDIDGEGYLMHSGYYYKLIRLKKSPPSEYLNNLEKVPVERVIFSEPEAVGIGMFVATDPNPDGASSLIGSVDPEQLAGDRGEVAGKAFRLDGELNIANRGLIEFVVAISK